MIRPDSMLESQNPTCDSYPVPLGDGLGQKHPLRRTPRLPISIPDRRRDGEVIGALRNPSVRNQTVLCGIIFRHKLVANLATK